MDVETIEPRCATVMQEALSADEAEQLAAGFKLLADPIRLRLLSPIANAPGGETACAT